MPITSQLREAAREIFDQTLAAVDPSDAVRRAVTKEGSRLRICDSTVDVTNRPIYAIAIGKAATAMSAALDNRVGDLLSAGLLTGPANDDESARPKRWHLYQGGHPLPNENSLEAASHAFSLLERANKERALIIFLISGGGSAMMEWPATDDISLADLRSANKTLVACGASISEINSIRRAFSAVKGGKLAARAPDCDQITLIVSDVTAGQDWEVASGPTLDPPADAPDAQEIIERYQLSGRMPPVIVKRIDAQTAKSSVAMQRLGRHFVLLDNDSALHAAAESARARGFVTEIADDISDQPIEEGWALLLSRLEALRETNRGSGKTICLVSGGEFSCPVGGDGIGGRNLETALRLANDRRLARLPAAGVCAGTDGIDGNSPAAGALIDDTTLIRAQAIALAPADFLKRSDSYSFFVALGDVLSTGLTGTNVRDVRILLSYT